MSTSLSRQMTADDLACVRLLDRIGNIVPYTSLDVVWLLLAMGPFMLIFPATLIAHIVHLQFGFNAHVADLVGLSYLIPLQYLLIK